MRRRLATTITLVGALALSALPGAASAASTGPSSAAPCNREQVVLRTFHIEVEIAKKTYRPGDRIKIDVVVTRPAHEDPLGLEQPIDPPVSQPAAGIGVGAGINIGDVFVYAITETDSEGKGRLSARLPRYTPRGKALVDVLAKEVQAQTTCAELWELGYRQFPSAFQVKP